MNIKLNLIKGVVFLILAIFLILPNFAEAVVHVNGYYRSNGTYVAPHYRSDPDGIKSNNWSYPGNTNPYTGVTAPGGSTFYSAPSYTPTWTFDNQTYYSASTYNAAKAAWLTRHKEGIKNLYRTLLEREPTQDEVDYWANREGDINVIKQDFLNSDEYKNLQNMKAEKIAQDNKSKTIATSTTNDKPGNSSENNSWIWWLLGSGGTFYIGQLIYKKYAGKEDGK